MALPPACRPVGQPHRTDRRFGFTLLELMIVVAIIGVIATISLTVLSNIRQRNAIALGPRQLQEALETARNSAMASGRDVVFVMIAPTSVADAFKCGDGALPQNDDRCVRYWILEDYVTPATGALADWPNSTYFDTAAQLDAFDPAAITGQTLSVRGAVEVTGQGDIVLDKDTLPGSLYVGRHPGYTAPSVPATSIFSGIPLTSACGFCTGSTTVRALVRFRPDGTVRLGVGAAAAATQGGVIFLNASRNGNAPATPTLADVVPDTRAVAILQPSGMITDRLTRAP